LLFRQREKAPRKKKCSPLEDGLVVGLEASKLQSKCRLLVGFLTFGIVKNSVLFVLKHCGNMMQNDNQHPGYSDELAFVYFDRCVHVDKCNLQSETETFSAVTAYMTVVGF